MSVFQDPTFWYNSVPKWKKREIVHPNNFVGTSWFEFFGSRYSVSSVRTPVTQRQHTLSDGNPWPRSKGTWLDVGSDFFTFKESFEPGNCFGPYLVKSVVVNPQFFYEGPLFPVAPYATNYPVTPHSNASALDAWGTSAIAATSPTSSHAQLAVALGELITSGLPGMMGAQLLKNSGRTLLQKSGDEYLNLEFGIKPLIRDVQDLVKAVRTSEEILAQFRRDSGRMVRRRFELTLPEVVEETTTTGATVWSNPPLVSQQFSNFQPHQGTLTKTSKVSQKRWFSGAFTYHAVGLGESERVKRSEQEARILYGLTLTPEVLWNLTPWSWAADWIWNMGSIVANQSMFAMDGLILRYGYVMETTTKTDTYTLTGHGAYGAPASLVCSFTSTVKQRRRATPFGFGFTDVPFDTRQKAIIAALMASKTGPRGGGPR